MNDNDGTGLFTDMPNDEHHRRSAIGSSGLKLFKKSPLHYWAQYLDPNRERTEPTPAMKLGSAWHTAVFEPAEFQKRYTVIPEGLDRRTKEGKQLYAEIEASGLEPISSKDAERVRLMGEACRAHPVGRVLFSQPAICEASIFTREQLTGVLCKIRPDYMIEPCQTFPHGLIVDGKSCEDASPEGFAKSVWNYSYGLQAAWYVDNFQKHYRTDQPPGFVWMAQEKDLPQATAFYSAGADIIAAGRREYSRLLVAYARCLSTNVWPGYPTAIQALELPVWAQKQMQEAA